MKIVIILSLLFIAGIGLSCTRAGHPVNDAKGQPVIDVGGDTVQEP